MFTGLIERVGTIAGRRDVSGGQRLRIEAGSMADTCAVGASICVSGACLTVASVKGSIITFDVVTETLKQTTLGRKPMRERVNLERSLRVGDRLDGHFVQGHIDGTAVVKRLQASPREHVVWLQPGPKLMPYLIRKGSVAVDGVSLTIAEISADAFSVALIPTTLAETTLASLTSGDIVNIETDILTRTMVDRLEKLAEPGGITLDTLRASGFA